MEATIKKVKNGYLVTFGDDLVPIEEYVFRDGDLKGAFERIDSFFLGCEKPKEKLKEN